MKSITLKLNKMRKADECVVYPTSYDEGYYYIQGERLIAKIDKKTGEGICNYRCKGHNGFVWLSAPSAEKCKLSESELAQIESNQYKSGNEIVKGSHVFIA